MTFDNNSKAKPWRTHYSILLHVGFPWNHDDLPNEPAVNSTPIFITEEMICNTISQMKREKKATGCSGVTPRNDTSFTRTHHTTSDKACK